MSRFDTCHDRYPNAGEEGCFEGGRDLEMGGSNFETGGLELEGGSARDVDRQVLIRLDPAGYGRLSTLAMVEGVAPTTMARMLLRGAIAERLRERAA